MIVGNKGLQQNTVHILYGGLMWLEYKKFGGSGGRSQVAKEYNKYGG